MITDPRRYCLIASRPRSGTHWLKSLLGSLPDVSAFEEEVFHPAFRGRPGFWDGMAQPADWLSCEARPGASVIVYAAHPNQRTPDIDATATHPIILYRRDLLAAYVSYQLADRANAWRTLKALPETEPATNDKPLPGDRCYTPLDLAAELSCSTDTISKYAKQAHVATPGRGERSRRYSTPQATKIVKRIADYCGSANVKRNAKEFLEILRKPA